MTDLANALAKKGYTEKKGLLFTWLVKGGDAWLLGDGVATRGRYDESAGVRDCQAYYSEGEALSALDI